MSSECDQILEAKAPHDRVAARAGTPSPRLVARLFSAAGNPMRVRLLRCLLRPLGPLGAAGVAAGAFAAFLQPRNSGEPAFDLDAVAQLSSWQVRELAHFVEQVDPQALQNFASLVSGSPTALATFSASALVLLYRQLQAVRPAA